MHTHNKQLPRLELYETMPNVSELVLRKTSSKLKAISQFEHHKKLTERNKARELELKRQWPKGLVRFVPDWKGGFELGGGGPQGVSTDVDGNQTKSNAACFGGMVRYHHTLFPNEEKPLLSTHHSYNREVSEGNEFLKPSGYTQKSYGDTQTRFVAVLSMNPDHTSNSAIEYMELLMEQPLIKEVFQNPGVEIVEFKCDNGNHFISGETLHYAVVTLPKQR